MQIPKGMEVEGRGDFVLKLKKNLYGQKQAGRTWYNHLASKLQECGFEPSEHDECVFYNGKAIYVVYTDDSVLTGPDDAELDHIIQGMKKVGLKITVEGDIGDFLGVQIQRKSDGTFELTQPHLIDQILKDLKLDRPETKIKRTPTAVNKILCRHLDSEAFDNHFNYRSVIGKLNYLEKSSRADISYAVHQCARFSANPRQEHGEAVKWLGRYLLTTRDEGMIFDPNSQSFEREITIHEIRSGWQLTDLLTHGVNERTLKRLRKAIMGWQL